MAWPAPWQDEGLSITLIVFGEPACVHPPILLKLREAAGAGDNFRSDSESTMRRHLSNALGSYSDREEFQVDRVIVWVQLPTHGCRADWLQRADQFFESIWAAIPEVLSVAEQKSREMVAEFWKAHDEAEMPGQKLAVRGIWIDPMTGSADYDVGCNYEFNGPGGLPELPESHTITVSRDPCGNVLSHE
jgi:hypothetical protein